MPKLNRFEWLKAVLQCADLNSSTKVVASALSVQFANDQTGQLNPSLKTLDEFLAGMFLAIMKRCLRQLVEFGWLFRTEGRGAGNSTEYDLRVKRSHLSGQFCSATQVYRVWVSCCLLLFQACPVCRAANSGPCARHGSRLRSDTESPFSTGTKAMSAHRTRFGRSIRISLGGYGKTGCRGRGLAGSGTFVNRLQAHPGHRATNATTSRTRSFPAQGRGDPTRSEDRILRKDPVDLFHRLHSRQRVGGEADRRGIDRGPDRPHRLALPADTRVGTIRCDRRACLVGAHRFGPSDKKSVSTAGLPILAWNSSTSASAGPSGLPPWENTSAIPSTA